MTVADAAAQLHCSRRRVFQLLADGALRRVRVGRLTLVGTESITALLAPPAPRPTALPSAATIRADLKRRRVLAVAQP